MLNQDAMTPLYVQLMEEVEKSIRSGESVSYTHLQKESEAQKLPPQKKIFGAVLTVIKGQILIDCGNALLHGFPDSQRAEYAVLDPDHPLIRFQASGENLNQSAFAGTIVAYDGSYFSAVGLKMHVVKRCNGSEPFYNSIHLNHRCCLLYTSRCV